jgi:hypothetical protein
VREHEVRILGQTRQAPSDDVTHSFGDPDIGDGGCVADPLTVAEIDRSGLGQVAHHLVDEERIPLSLAMHGLGECESTAEQGVPGPRLEELDHLVLRQALKDDAFDAGLPDEIHERRRKWLVDVEVDVAIGADDQQWHSREPPHDVEEQLHRRLVRPLQVIDDEEDRRPLGGRREQRRHALEEPVPVGLRVAALGRDAELVGDLRHEAGEHGQVRSARFGELVDLGRRRVLAKRLDEGLIRKQRLLVTVPEEDGRSIAVHATRELDSDACLADPRFPDDEHDASFVVDGVVPSLVETTALGLASDEGSAVGGVERDGKRNRRRALPRDREGVDEFGQALQRAGTRRLEGVPGADEAADETRRQDLSGRSGIAEPLRDHHGQSVVVAVLLDRIARVQAHPQPEVRTASLAVRAIDAALHGHGAGDTVGSAREGDHEPVAHALHFVAVMGRDVVSQEPEMLAAETVGCNFTERRRDLGRLDEIGEQEGDRRGRRQGPIVRQLYRASTPRDAPACSTA